MIDFIKIGDVHHQNSYLNHEKVEGFKSWSAMYWEMYDSYKGTISDEKINNLMEIYKPLENKTSDLTANHEMNDPDSITGNAYSDFNVLERYYVKPMKYFYQYKSQAENTAEVAKENNILFKSIGNTYEAKKNAAIYNMYKDRKVSDFSYTEMYHYYLNYDFSTVLVLLICLYGIVRVYVCEKDARMEALLVSNINGGRKITMVKAAAVAIFVMGISLWFCVLDFLFFACHFHTFEGGNLPIYALQIFSTASVNITLGQYVVVSVLSKTLGFLAYGMVFLLVSRFAKNALIPFAVNLVICLGSILVGTNFAYSGFTLPKVMNPYSLLTNRILFGRTEFVNLFETPILSSDMAVIFAILIIVMALIVIYITSKKNMFIGVRLRKSRRQRMGDYFGKNGEVRNEDI